MKSKSFEIFLHNKSESSISEHRTSQDNSDDNYLLYH